MRTNKTLFHQDVMLTMKFDLRKGLFSIIQTHVPVPVFLGLRLFEHGFCSKEEEKRENQFEESNQKEPLLQDKKKKKKQKREPSIFSRSDTMFSIGWQYLKIELTKKNEYFSDVIMDAATAGPLVNLFISPSKVTNTAVSDTSITNISTRYLVVKIRDYLLVVKLMRVVWEQCAKG